MYIYTCMYIRKTTQIDKRLFEMCDALQRAMPRLSYVKTRRLSYVNAIWRVSSKSERCFLRCGFLHEKRSFPKLGSNVLRFFFFFSRNDLEGNFRDIIIRTFTLKSISREFSEGVKLIADRTSDVHDGELSLSLNRRNSTEIRGDYFKSRRIFFSRMCSLPLYFYTRITSKSALFGRV